MAKAKQADQTPPAADTRLPDFEKALDELEQIVARLEGGELSLEQSLKDFERGVHLTRDCHEVLQHAELKVQQLLEANGQLSFADFGKPDEQ